MIFLISSYHILVFHSLRNTFDIDHPSISKTFADDILACCTSKLQPSCFTYSLLSFFPPFYSFFLLQFFLFIVRAHISGSDVRVIFLFLRKFRVLPSIRKSHASVLNGVIFSCLTFTTIPFLSSNDIYPVFSLCPEIPVSIIRR